MTTSPAEPDRIYVDGLALADPYCPDHGDQPTTYDSCSCEGRARLLAARIAQLEADLAAAEAKLAAVDAVADRIDRRAQRPANDSAFSGGAVSAAIRAALATQPAP